MKKLIVNVMDKIEEKRERKERHKAIRAHIKENRPKVEAMKAREAYYKQLLAERNERLRKGVEEERKLYIDFLIKKNLRENQEAK